MHSTRRTPPPRFSSRDTHRRSLCRADTHSPPPRRPPVTKPPLMLRVVGVDTITGRPRSST
nr:MAG TPA: hypothetical protein [Caudoviricetes sp.]